MRIHRDTEDRREPYFKVALGNFCYIGCMFRRFHVACNDPEDPNGQEEARLKYRVHNTSLLIQ